MKIRSLASFVSIVGLLFVPILAQASGGTEISLKGEILDLACYVAHDGEGPDHVKCAVRCVKHGQPMGLLTDDGTVYVLFADHGDAEAFEKAKELAGKPAQISGSKSEKAGVKGITVHDVKAL